MPVLIFTKFNGVHSFFFQSVSINDVKKVIRDLKGNKPVGEEIPI